MIRSLCLATMLLTVGASTASAAVVSFIGTITSKTGSGGSFNIANGTNFSGGLTINDSVTNTASISTGQFTFGNGLQIFVTGGTVAIVGGNQIDFTITSAQTSPSASIGFSFTGVSGLGTGVNNAQLEKIIGSTTSFVMAENGAFPLYQGTITAVPEPGSVLALAGLFAGGYGYRWRKRRQAMAS